MSREHKKFLCTKGYCKWHMTRLLDQHLKPAFFMYKHNSDITSATPFLALNANKEMVFYPVRFIPQESQIPNYATTVMKFPAATTKNEIPLNKWVHIGCEFHSNGDENSVDSTTIYTRMKDVLISIHPAPICFLHLVHHQILNSVSSPANCKVETKI